ncbi:IclR family transcriptional regulator [Mycobacterium sp. AT1]|uniref:IclR family transcriptional regulator n=1 Tax=Mycobacterium sp. AT1 TaxID=1961706 RepID=UPI001301ECAA|nr:IclR family transcriptional regulator [Mycobacterium sp. AT1]
MQTYPVTEDGAPPAYPITSVDNALRLIRLFKDRDTLRLTDACSYLGVAHSTAHRLLAMLIHHGFVQQDPQSRTYRPGPTLLEIGLAVVEQSDFRTKAKPLLAELVDRFDETVHLMTLEGTMVRYLDAAESTRALRVAPRTGSLLPAHCTSGGKALLAELTDDRIRALYRDPATIAPQTDRSVSSVPLLIAALQEVRTHRYATNYEESEEGVGSVAVALHDARGVAVAAVAVAVPTTRLSQDRRKEIAAILIDRAAGLAL